MEFGTKVKVKAGTKTHWGNEPLDGLIGVIVDKPGHIDNHLPGNLRFVRFPAKGQAERFAWITTKNLEAVG